MPITVEHGPNQSRYASLIADSAKKTENYERLKQIAEFMQNVKQQNREYELGKKQNELTGRGQDITYDLGLKDVGIRGRGLDLQEVNQNRDYELGLRSADTSDREQARLEEQLRQQRELEILRMMSSNPNGARQAGLFANVTSPPPGSIYSAGSSQPWARGVTGTT